MYIILLLFLVFHLSFLYDLSVWAKQKGEDRAHSLRWRRSRGITHKRLPNGQTVWQSVRYG